VFRSLRARFILSHTLPVLVVLPLAGLLLIYVLESQVLLENLASELETQAVLVSSMVSVRAEMWHDPTQAQDFVRAMNAQVHARVMLLNVDGTLHSSSDPLDADRRGQALQLESWSDVAAGQNSVRVASSPGGTQSIHKEAVDVLVPVYGPDDRMVGVVRLSYLVESLNSRFAKHRTLIAGVVLGGLLLGVVAGIVLAANLERPLRQVTEAVSQMSAGHRSGSLSEQGPQEIRLLIRAVNTLVARLHSLEQARRKLLANLVHELGRPLGAFRSAIQALRGGADEDLALRRELLAGMEQQTGLLTRLLDDLASLHDTALGALELERRATDMNQWLANTLGPWREACQAKGLHWEADVTTPLPAMEIDPERLSQALGNLFSNACKYTPAGGTVSVDAGMAEGELWIRVSDTGPGIAPEEQTRIFEPLYRAQADRRFPQGMGLGLSIAHDLVAAHRGRIEVESAPGKGSQFTIWLPLKSQA
jgi:signal transduction histidine kinase